MSARILVVDDIEANRHLLQAKLAEEYYDVVTASNGIEALKAAHEHPPDLILLDVMMPEMDGYETCRRLKGDEALKHIPVVMVTTLEQQSERIKGLEAGADDFLTKPADSTILLARVRSLLRLKMLMDEWLAREEDARAAGVLDEESFFDRQQGDHFLLIDDDRKRIDQIMGILDEKHYPEFETDPEKALIRARNEKIDMVMINLGAAGFDPLRLCARVRSDEATRSMPILALADPHNKRRIARALDLGVNDILSQPVDRHELAARVRTQMRYKHFSEYLRIRFHESLEMSVTDSLTKLYNRRYLERKLPSLLGNTEKRPLSVLIADLDHFKRINDTYGHDAGDDLLREVAGRISASTRALDMACRLGGEEFLVIMRETSCDQAVKIAERLRQAMHDIPFSLKDHDRNLTITISLGVAQAMEGEKTGPLLKRADQALYRAKKMGRNRVVLAETGL